MTDTVVISGAAAAPVGGAAATPLLSVPELVDLAIADSGTGLTLVIHNPTGGPLRVAVEDVGDIAIPPAGSTALPLRPEPGEARIHLQALSTTLFEAVMVIVTVEPSDDGPITVGQAIGARTC